MTDILSVADAVAVTAPQPVTISALVSEPETGIVWEYLQGVPGVVIVAREAGVAVAVIEMCPRVGFRLTNCRTGKDQSFISLEEAKLAYATQHDAAE